jgi:hypothetical protein
MGRYGQSSGNQHSGSGSIGRTSPIKLFGMAGLAVALAYGGYRYMQYQKGVATEEATGCLSSAKNPVAVLYMIDATDRLTRETAQRIRQRILDEVNALPRYSKVLIAPFGEDTASPLNVVFNRCLPGKAANARADEGAQLLERDYKAFETALNDVVSKLESLPDSKKSPIADQVVRAASDPVLHWEGEKRELVLITDGLESTIYWQNNLKLPDPPDGIFRSVSAEYFEIGNAKAVRLQRRQVRLEWKSWLERGGATVKVSAPGFPVSGT